MTAEHERTQTVFLLGAFPPQTQGIPGYCGALARALAATGPVHALGFKAMYPRWLFPGVRVALDPTSALPEADGLSVRHSLAWYNPMGWCWVAWRTPADVVHIQWWSLPLLPVCLTFALIARLRRKPVVVTVHNVLPHESNPWFLRASRLLYRCADHLIVQSEVNREQLQAHFGIKPQQVSCIPMGVDERPAALPEQRSARLQLRLPVDRPTVLFFGIIRPYKGLADLLRALALIVRARPDVQLVIAGKPWEPWERYQRILADEGLSHNVHLRLDYVPESEVPLYVAASDIVVLPYTHFDAQSAVGAQMLAMGRPLLLTRTGGLPELVGNDERWIVPPRDPEALAARLEAMLEDREATSAAFGEVAAIASTAMSWEASAAAHDVIYQRLLEGKET